jgi:hypothetical protein
VAKVGAIISRHRRIDALVNNAGIIHRQDIVDTATPDFRKVIETNLISQFVVSREVGRHMLARKYGRIVNISSVLGVVGRASVAGYVSAKHGLIGLTKNLAAELGPHVTANAIAPGYIRTELNVPLQQNKDFNAMLRKPHRRRALGQAGRPAGRAPAARVGCRQLHHRPHAGDRWRTLPDPRLIHDRHSSLGNAAGGGCVRALRHRRFAGLDSRPGRSPKADYVGTIDVSAEDARLYRAVPFEWQVNNPAGTFKGNDTAHVRIDPSGERTVLCGWVPLDKGGASIRATRWLSEARLAVGDIKVTALFIAPVDRKPGDGLNAGACASTRESGLPPMPR